MTALPGCQDIPLTDEEAEVVKALKGRFKALAQVTRSAIPAEYLKIEFMKNTAVKGEENTAGQHTVFTDGEPFYRVEVSVSDQVAQNTALAFFWGTAMKNFDTVRVEMQTPPTLSKNFRGDLAAEGNKIVEAITGIRRYP